MVFATFYNALSAKLSYLSRESAAINLKVVGKLLAVIGDIKALGSELICFQLEVREQLFSRSPLRGYLKTVMEINALCRKILH